MAEFDQELKTYEQHKARLLEEAAGKYVLIQGDEVAGTFDSQMDGVREGYKRYGIVPFLVKLIVELEVPLNFTRLAGV